MVPVYTENILGQACSEMNSNVGNYKEPNILRSSIYYIENYKDTPFISVNPSLTGGGGGIIPPSTLYYTESQPRGG